MTDVLKQTAQARVVPVFFHQDSGVALEVVMACQRAGMGAFEFTNRGKEAPAVFDHLVKNRHQFAGMSLGIGTIMDQQQAQQFVNLGADFIVSPILDEAVAAVCNAAGTPWVPGCGTLTEVVKGVRLGAPLVKIFPGSVLGPEFVKNALGPCPDLKLMPTGGVTPDEQNLKAWFGAGVHCVGMGSQLFSKELMANRQFDLVELEIKKVVALTKSL